MQIQVIGLNLAVRFEPLRFKNFEEAECQRREKMRCKIVSGSFACHLAGMRGRRYLRERERRLTGENKHAFFMAYREEENSFKEFARNFLRNVLDDSNWHGMVLA